MALDVSISNGATTYRLKATSVTIVYDRSPFQMPLPSNINPRLLDLGQFKPSIVIEGRLDEAATTDGGVTVPSKNNLEDAVRQWYNNTITLTVSSDAYVGKIVSFRITLSAAQEQWWEYQLKLLTQGRS